MEWKNFTLIGLGLIGGSIAKAIKKTYPTARISVLEKDQHSVEMAISEGIIEKGLQSIEEIRIRSFSFYALRWNGTENSYGNWLPSFLLILY